VWLDLDLDLNNLTRDLTLAQDQARHFIHDIVRTLEAEGSVKFDGNGSYVGSRLLSDLEKFEAIRNYTEARRLSALLDDLILVAEAENVIEMRDAQRRFVSHVFKYAYEGYEVLTDNERPGLQKWLRIARKGRWEDGKKIALEAHWWLQIVRARESGKLPAWEGIRIVREQIAS
jgi:hypothetical protein